VRKALPLAFEGKSLYEHRNESYGDMALLVAGQFRSTSDKSRTTMEGNLKEHKVRMVARSRVQFAILTFGR
jgi:hypothetical protein